jgi:tetratricopeptide (TPR) repeat protein
MCKIAKVKNRREHIKTICCSVIFFTFGQMAFGQTPASQVPSKNTLAANEALKKSLSLEHVSGSEIRELLSEKKYAELDRRYEEIFDQYINDVNYESYLLKSYDVFVPEAKLPVSDLDGWVDKTGSYVAYTARGIYEAEEGFCARGKTYIHETSQAQLDEMIKFHQLAAKDLQAAIHKNPRIMPAYYSLIKVGFMSGIPPSPDETLRKALENDPRSYYVRYAYMNSLWPRWGGSYEQMTRFANESQKDVSLNPRIWSLQGEAEADQADLAWEQHDYQSAVDHYTLAMKYGERAFWLQNRGVCYESLGQPDKALADYKRMLYYGKYSWAQKKIDALNKH